MKLQSHCTRHKPHYIPDHKPGQSFCLKRAIAFFDCNHHFNFYTSLRFLDWEGQIKALLIEVTSSCGKSAVAFLDRHHYLDTVRWWCWRPSPSSWRPSSTSRGCISRDVDSVPEPKDCLTSLLQIQVLSCARSMSG